MAVRPLTQGAPLGTDDDHQGYESGVCTEIGGGGTALSNGQRFLAVARRMPYPGFGVIRALSRSMFTGNKRWVAVGVAALAVLVGRAPAYLKVKGGSLYKLGLPAVSPGLPSQILLQRPDIRAARPPARR